MIEVVGHPKPSVGIVTITVFGHIGSTRAIRGIQPFPTGDPWALEIRISTLLAAHTQPEMSPMPLLTPSLGGFPKLPVASTVNRSDLVAQIS